jgi:hypothetical protein
MHTCLLTAAEQEELNDRKARLDLSLHVAEHGEPREHAAKALTYAAIHARALAEYCSEVLAAK